MPFYETSAKLNQGLEEVFENLAKLAMKRNTDITLMNFQIRYAFIQI